MIRTRIQKVSPEEASLLRCAVLGLLGREAGLRRELRAARQRGADPAPLREALLQIVLFAGFPRAIQALSVFSELFSTSPEEGTERSSALRAKGERLCRRIYGPLYGRMMIRMRKLHPVLADAILEEGYGRILSRPFLNAAQRELLVVAMLTASGDRPQLEAHLRGAQRVGVSRERLRHALSVLRGIVPESKCRMAEGMLRTG